MNNLSQQAIIKQLQSNNTTEVLQGIELFAQQGEAQYLPLVIDLLDSAIDEEIIGAITSMLGQLKQQDAVPYLIEAITDENRHDIREELLAACWENGLNYLAHLSVFIQIMIEADFMSAFEAHTVITNMSGKISTEERLAMEDKIDHSLVGMNAEKLTLLQEVKDFLYALEDGIEPAEY